MKEGICYKVLCTIGADNILITACVKIVSRLFKWLMHPWFSVHFLSDLFKQSTSSWIFIESVITDENKWLGLLCTCIGVDLSQMAKNLSVWKSKKLDFSGHIRIY